MAVVCDSARAAVVHEQIVALVARHFKVAFAADEGILARAANQRNAFRAAVYRDAAFNRRAVNFADRVRFKFLDRRGKQNAGFAAAVIADNAVRRVLVARNRINLRVVRVDYQNPVRQVHAVFNRNGAGRDLEDDIIAAHVRRD